MASENSPYNSACYGRMLEIMGLATLHHLMKHFCSPNRVLDAFFENYHKFIKNSDYIISVYFNIIDML